MGTARIGMISFRMQKISFWWVILEKTSSAKNNDAQWMELCLSLGKYIEASSPFPWDPLKIAQNWCLLGKYIEASSPFPWPKHSIPVLAFIDRCGKTLPVQGEG